MYKTINEWVDYIDGGCAVLHFDFHVFKKSFHLRFRSLKIKPNVRITFFFKMQASVYFSADIGDMRLEKIDPEEYNWQVFEMSYHPEGIGNLSNAVIPEYQSNANFLINMNSMLIAVEAETVRFDDQSFYAYHPKS